MISRYISAENIKLNLESSDRDESLAELLEILVTQQPQINRKEALSALIERESKMSTAIFKNVAVPHAVIKSVKTSCIAIGISKKGIDFGSTEVTPEKADCKIIFEILFSEEDTDGHLRILRDILKLLENPEFEKNVIEAKNSYEIYDIINKIEV